MEGFDANLAGYKSFFSFKKNRDALVLNSNIPFKQDLNVGEMELKKHLNAWLDVNKKHAQLLILKAPTGIGKTELLVQALTSNEAKTYLVALPTHALKDEISSRLG